MYFKMFNIHVILNHNGSKSYLKFEKEIWILQRFLCDIVSEASVSQNCVEMNRQAGRALIALYQLHKYSVI